MGQCLHPLYQVRPGEKGRLKTARRGNRVLTQQNSTDADRGDPEIGAIVSGKIIRVTQEGILVSLPDENTGVLSIDPPDIDVENDPRFCIDAVVKVQIVSQEADKRFRLVQIPPESSGDAFDEEFHRLRDVLTNGPVRTTVTTKQQSDEPFEESLKDWVRRVEASLPLFHTHRSKRLRTAMDNREKDDGGR